MFSFNVLLQEEVVYLQYIEASKSISFSCDPIEFLSSIQLELYHKKGLAAAKPILAIKEIKKLYLALQKTLQTAITSFEQSNKPQNCFSGFISKICSFFYAFWAIAEIISFVRVVDNLLTRYELKYMFQYLYDNISASYLDIVNFIKSAQLFYTKITSSLGKIGGFKTKIVQSIICRL